MIFLQSLIYKKQNKNVYPFNIPLIQSLESLDFKSEVTFLIGENGSGKSTLIEGLAAAARSITVGGNSVEDDLSLESARILAEHLSLKWHEKTHKGFYMRSEDFLGFTKLLNKTKAELKQRLAELDEEYEKMHASQYALSLAKGPILRSLYEMKSKYGEDLDAYSHGESFLKLFESRIIPGGLYILDEPEIALSPMRQLSFISILKQAVAEGSQFIIATHSPILMAFPGAVIYSLDNLPVKEINYEEIEHVKITKDFLKCPERYIKYL